jgi:hypothetical protein
MKIGTFKLNANERNKFVKDADDCGCTIIELTKDTSPGGHRR